MKRFLLVPDSFKGSLTSLEAAEIMESVLRDQIPDCEIRKIPISDGGEGFLDCLLAMKPGIRIPLRVTGPLGTPVEAFYGMWEDGTALIELAQAAGLGLAGPHPDPSRSTTFGVGQLIRDAAGRGAKRIFLGLGGSATNDAGTGLAAALGVRFADARDREIFPSGGNLGTIAHLSAEGLLPGLDRMEIVALCDVKNPLLGPRGATRTYAPQKGADPAQIAVLEENMRSYAALLKEWADFDVGFEGAGAAGGTPVALRLFLNAKIRRGIEAILDLADFDSLLTDADAVFTGEGRIDEQTFQGKVIGGLSARCASKGVPLFALVGQAALTETKPYPDGLTAVFPILSRCSTLEQAILSAPENLRFTMENLARTLKSR